MTVVDETTQRSELTAEQRAMVEANLPLVAWVVNRFYRQAQGDDFDEKCADGMFGLIRAAQLYDPDKGFTFSTYATNWIRSAVQRGRGIFEGSGYRHVTGHSTGRPLGEYQRPLSLDRPVGDDGSASVGDFLADDADVEGVAVARAFGEHMQAALVRACRDPFDLAVVEMIAAGSSLTDVAREFKVTVTAVQLRRARLLAKVRHPVYGLVARIPKAKEAAMTDTALARLNGPGSLHCEHCDQKFAGPQGLGAHRRAAHGIVGTSAGAVAGRVATKGARPARPVLVELVAEMPPAPVVKEPKIKISDRILAAVEQGDLAPGEWMRCAIFVSSRAAKAMATKLQKATEGGPYEWYAPGDDRLFVRVRPDE